EFQVSTHYARRVDGPARRERLADSRLYLVLEARPHGDDPRPLLDAALRGGVDVVQLREKGLEDDALMAAAAPFRAACDEHGGIELSNVAEAADAGAPGAAVVRAIRDAGDPEAAARELRAALDR